jgi:hypothetical protein
MYGENSSRLIITMPKSITFGFSSLLQYGILIAIDRPIEIGSFLLALPGFTAEYLEHNVQTIFVNGSAADNLNTPLGDGGTLALSAAMPGLAGAIFRRQSVHSSLRSAISTHEETEKSGAGYITLKLFNRIAVDRGFDLMAKGITIRGQSLYKFAIKNESVFQPPIQLFFADRLIDYSDLLNIIQSLPVLEVQAKILNNS